MKPSLPAPASNMRWGTISDIRPMLELDRRVYAQTWWFDAQYAEHLWRKNPQIYRMLDLNRQIRGYWSIIPLTEVGYWGLLRGNLSEQALESYVLPWDSQQPLYLYFDSLAMDPTIPHSSLYAAQIMRDAMQHVEAKAKTADIPLIFAMPVSPRGLHIVQKMGWTPVAKQPQGMPFYEISVKEWLRS